MLYALHGACIIVEKKKDQKVVFLEFQKVMHTVSKRIHSFLLLPSLEHFISTVYLVKKPEKTPELFSTDLVMNLSIREGFLFLPLHLVTEKNGN